MKIICTTFFLCLLMTFSSFANPQKINETLQAFEQQDITLIRERMGVNISFSEGEQPKLESRENVLEALKKLFKKYPNLVVKKMHSSTAKDGEYVLASLSAKGYSAQLYFFVKIDTNSESIVQLYITPQKDDE